MFRLQRSSRGERFKILNIQERPNVAAAKSRMGNAGWPPRTALLPSNIHSGITISAKAATTALQSRTAGLKCIERPGLSGLACFTVRCYLHDRDSWIAESPNATFDLFARCRPVAFIGRRSGCGVEVGGAEVVVASGFLAGVDVGWRDEPGDAGADLDGPVFFVDYVVVVGAEQCRVFCSGCSAAGE